MLYSYAKTPYLTLQAFTCLKSTIETLGKGLAYVQRYQRRYQKDVIEFVLVPSLLTLNYFKSSLSFPIVNFEQVNIWRESYLTFIHFFWCVYWKEAGLKKKQCREFCYFSYFPHSGRCNLCKPSILKWFIQWILESLYKCNPQILGTQK